MESKIKELENRIEELESKFEINFEKIIQAINPKLINEIEKITGKSI